MWIVDWEYSGMNDPWWDLGDLSVEGGFDQDQDIALMQAYCQGEPQPWQYARMIIYKAMCDLLWTLWGLIQHADNNPAEDFWAYATSRFERCRTLMNSNEFERQQQRLG
jgi:thiamine kinase-like enzyme